MTTTGSDWGVRPWVLENLPQFPWVLTRLIALFAAPVEEVDLRVARELIRRDPALVSELLRRANAAAHAPIGRVQSVDHALHVLGLHTVRRIVLTIRLRDYLGSALNHDVLKRCWQHCLACAFSAEQIAQYARLRPDQAYTAGLLHDLGRLALLVNFPKSYADLLGLAASSRQELIAAERALFELDHCELGSCLAIEWQFPDELIRIIAQHHQPAQNGTFTLQHLISLTCRLADQMGFGVAPISLPDEVEEIRDQLPAPACWLLEPGLESFRARVLEQVTEFV